MGDSDGPDAIRAYLCAFSWRGQELLAPVSTLAIQNELDRHELAIRAANVLPLLFEVGDVQRMARGYWLPAALRFIDCGVGHLAACGLPSRRLLTHYGLQLNSLGISREVVGSIPNDMALIISLKEWLGEPSDTNRWLESLLADANWTQPFAISELRYFRSWRARYNDRWIDGSRLLVSQKGAVLARFAQDGKPAIYCLARLHSGLVDGIMELPPETDIARLICALRRRDGDATRAQISALAAAEGATVQVELLPRREEVFFRAIGKVKETTEKFIRSVEVPRRWIPAAVAVLESLGVEAEVSLR